MVVKCRDGDAGIIDGSGTLLFFVMKMGFEALHILGSDCAQGLWLEIADKCTPINALTGIRVLGLVASRPLDIDTGVLRRVLLVAKLEFGRGNILLPPSPSQIGPFRKDGVPPFVGLLEHGSFQGWANPLPIVVEEVEVVSAARLVWSAIYPCHSQNLGTNVTQMSDEQRITPRTLFVSPWGSIIYLVELKGIEPSTSALRTQRSPS